MGEYGFVDPNPGVCNEWRQRRSVGATVAARRIKERLLERSDGKLACNPAAGSLVGVRPGLSWRLALLVSDRR